MNKSHLMDAFRNARGLSMVMGGALALLASGTTAATDPCGDGGEGSQDIESLSASFDAATHTITVDLTLCAEADTKTKYRVHFDHTAPFATDLNRNGDTVINDDDFCVTTSDSGMMHRGKRDTGPGAIAVDGKHLSYWVSMADLNPALAIGDTILVWADTQDKGIVDRAPNTDDSDGCSKPEVTGEFVALVLNTFDCSKPIDELTMIWDGVQTIGVKAWKGSVGSTLLADIGNIIPGEEVTVSGHAGSPNDVTWEIFSNGTTNKIGESIFHVSCSDGEMNGAEDCGKHQGNGKDNDAGLINDWLFEGMVDSDETLDCIP